MLYLLTIFSLLLPALAINARSNSNVAVYWGQNSGGSQQRLSYYCDSDAVDIVILSFMHQFPSPIQLNFANACEGTYTANGILQCQTIAEDIKYCQNNGKTILLSLGGAAGSYGFSDDATAKQFAHTLWDLFGNSKNLATNDRPFYDAVLDGFDFDIENNWSTGYPALATELRTLFQKDTSKNYYLGAAPQCPYPDASVGPLLKQSEIDFVFIQFYNNYCNLGSSSFNWDTWLDYAETDSPNKNIKLFVGVPASSRAAGSGYNDPSAVSQYLTSDILNSKYFGGISMWDVSAGWSNTNSNGNFVENMKAIVKKASPGEETTSSSTTTTTTTTSTTISSSSSSSKTSKTSTTSTTSSSISSTTSSTTSSTSSSSTSSSTSSTTSSSTTSSQISTTSTAPTSSTSLSSSTISTSASTSDTTSVTSSETTPVVTPSSSSSAITIPGDSTTTGISKSSSTKPATSTTSALSSSTTTVATIPDDKEIINTPTDTETTSKPPAIITESDATTITQNLTPSTTTKNVKTTSTNIVTEWVWAPTTLRTLTTTYQILTTRTHIETVFAEPSTVVIYN
ncbi:chitinase 3 [Candida albicans P87]|nr:chitinase 3 [Candida albicans P87]KGU20918.1 chitinase 3 [Candida albicans P75063]KHC27880.1 chitinase 3 [Candida albicans Ca6]KHC59066.1 chitinase 3 [Candida albicans P75016]RLP67438.1 chitinase 3 [Candida albicans Ca529L]